LFGYDFHRCRCGIVWDEGETTLWFSNEGSCLLAGLVEKMVESGKGKEEQRLKLGFFFFFFCILFSLSLSLGVEK
jgi:hypothetical protein